MHHRAALSALLLAVAVVVACDRPASSKERGAVRNQPATPAARPPGYVIDSALPPEELLRRFRVGLDSTDTLNGPMRRDDLVRRFLDAVQRSDRAAVQRLGITKSEFAYVVFPNSKTSKPPYNQPPEIEWLLMARSSDVGLDRLLKRVGERGLTFKGYVCEQPAGVEGRVKYWSGCTVRVVEKGVERRLRLFGAIVESGGRFKFRDFGNAF